MRKPAPKCPNCQSRMKPGHVKKTRLGDGRYFACGKDGCAGIGKPRWAIEGPTAYRLITPPRGRRRKGTGQDTCPNPECGKRDTLRRAGYIEQAGRTVPRVECVACGRRSLLDESTGRLTLMRPPGFQRKHPPPPCPDHNIDMERGRSSVRDGKRNYRWNCPKPSCPRSVVLDADGNEIESIRSHEASYLGFKCDMPGCGKPREHQHDRRRRFCPQHGALSPVQRHRLRRALYAATTDELNRRGGDLVIVGSSVLNTRGALVEFAMWLKVEIARTGVSISEAARRSRTPENTVLNWAHGVSMPRNDRDFGRLGQFLGVTLADFYHHFAHHYGPRRLRAADGR